MFVTKDPCQRCADTRRYKSNHRCPTCSSRDRKRWRAEHPDRARELGRRNDRKRSGTFKRRYSGATNDFMRRYGLDRQQAEVALTNAQFGICTACGHFACNLHIDHDHATGALRGQTCGRCNLALGHAKDSPVRLRLLADYIERTTRIPWPSPRRLRA